MKHIHLPSCESTQSYLLDYLSRIPVENEQPPHILVSTSEQLAGKGRKGNNWSHYSGSLAFSFTYPMTKVITLLPLAVGVSLCEFFREHYSVELSLKWPNDLMIQRGKGPFKKCGGIITRPLGTHYALIGIGINIERPGMSPKEEFEFDSIPGLHTLDSLEEKVPAKLYRSLLEISLQGESIVQKWRELCCHLNEQVCIKTESGKSEGRFDLGPDGAAVLINSEGAASTFYSCQSLRKIGKN